MVAGDIRNESSSSCGIILIFTKNWAGNQVANVLSPPQSGGKNGYMIAWRSFVLQRKLFNSPTIPLLK